MPGIKKGLFVVIGLIAIGFSYQNCAEKKLVLDGLIGDSDLSSNSLDLMLSSLEYEILEGEILELTLPLRATRTSSLAVNWEILPAPESSGLVANQDFAATAGVMNLAAGASEGRLSIVSINNTVANATKSYEIRLSAPGSDPMFLSLNLLDDDNPSPVTAATASYGVMEGNDLQITLQRATGVTRTLDLIWVLEASSTTPTQLPSSDFTVITGNLNIPVGASGAISLNTIDNLVASVSRSYRLRIQESGSASAPLILGVTVVDDDAASIAAGHNHACLISEGALRCFGQNNFGQLGIGNLVNTSTPTLITGMNTGVKKVAVGTLATCAIQNGALYCWGRNSYGVLALTPADNNAHSAPIPVTALSTGVTDVSVGYYSACAIKSGALYCWGNNAYGQLGLNSRTTQTSPQPITSLSTGVTAIALADSDALDAATTPVPRTHACAIKDQALYCWGYNGFGQLGNGQTATSLIPVSVLNMSSGVTRVAVAENSTCAVKDGIVSCWGYNANGELGLGTTTNSAVPAQVPGLLGKRITNLTAGGNHFCAVADLKVYCWGYNARGQIGNGTLTVVTRPYTHLGMDSNILSIAASRVSSYAIQGNKLMSWGDNVSLQLGGYVGPQVSAPYNSYQIP